MPTIVFRGVDLQGQALCGPFPTITLKPSAVICGDALFAEFRNWMWWVDGTAYTGADFLGPITVKFQTEGDAALCVESVPSLRLASNYLHAGDRIIARAEATKWISLRDPRHFDEIVLT